VQEAPIRFRSHKWEIEGLYHAGHTKRGVVITHPHPMYGGDMFNPVVAAIVAAYQKRAFATLRFNFRGTGKSTGSYDKGDGEKADVTAAVDFLQREGCQEIHLSGYSFGAWVNAMALQDELIVQGMTMLAPPVLFIDFEDGVRLPMLSAVVVGSRDEFGPVERIRSLMSQWNPDSRLDVIEGADHFFFGFFDEITRRLAQRLQHCDQSIR
jgi:alpha/beta superfamily hydrolase